MIKYFSIAIANATKEQEKAIADEWKGYAWWHGIPGFWLLRDHAGEMTANSIRDKLRELAPSSLVMVVDIHPHTWAATGMVDSNREWLKTYWPPEGN